MSESYSSSILPFSISPSSNVENTNFFSNMASGSVSFFKNNSTVRVIIYIVIAVLSVIILVNLIIKSYNIYIEIKQKSPWLLHGTKDAKKYQYIIQNLEDNPLQLIKPSVNRAGGLEFTYGCWIYIDNYDYRRGFWKSIFHKGSAECIDCPHTSSERSSQTPGLWLGPDNNTLHVFLNTFINSDSATLDLSLGGSSSSGSVSTTTSDSSSTNLPAHDHVSGLNAVHSSSSSGGGTTTTTTTTTTTSPGGTSTAPGALTAPNECNEKVSCPAYSHNSFNDDKNNILESAMVEDIPVSNWVNIIVAVRQHNLDIYINGILKKRKLLKYLPNQNSGTFHMNTTGGFAGFISNVRYFNYYISEGELFKYVSSGPSSLPPANSIGKPPYLAERWWLR